MWLGMQLLIGEQGRASFGGQMVWQRIAFVYVCSGCVPRIAQHAVKTPPCSATIEGHKSIRLRHAA